MQCDFEPRGAWLNRDLSFVFTCNPLLRDSLGEPLSLGANQMSHLNILWRGRRLWDCKPSFHRC